MTPRRTLAAAALLGVAMLVAPGLMSKAPAYEDRFPYSIMTPEPGSAPRQAKSSKRAKTVKTSRGRVKLLAKQPDRRKVTARGSSNPVLPQVPRTEAIPPIRGGIRPAKPVQGDPGFTFAPGLRPIPNLPPTGKGPESFQDRASRCAHQTGVYGVPNESRNVYMGSCL